MRRNNTCINRRTQDLVLVPSACTSTCMVYDCSIIRISGPACLEALLWGFCLACCNRRGLVKKKDLCVRFLCDAEPHSLPAQQVFEAQEIGQGPKRTDFPCKHEFVSWEYLHHNDGTWSGGGLANGAEILPTGAVRVRQVSHRLFVQYSTNYG